MLTSSILAMSFSMAVATTGPTRTAGERSSFTDRVQSSLGIARTEQATTLEPAAPIEPTSFTDRVQQSQGLRSNLEAGEPAPMIEDEATSFINRVKTSQGVAEERSERPASTR